MSGQLTILQNDVTLLHDKFSCSKAGLNEQQADKYQMVSVSDGVFRRHVRDGGRAWSQQAYGALFQLVPDRVDGHNRRYNDRHGRRQRVGRQHGGQEQIA